MGLFNNKKRKREAEAAQATITKLIESGQELTDHQKQTMIFASDGNISRREKKLLKQYVRQDNKTERAENRVLGRVENARNRALSRISAYQNGIDPRAWTKNIADGLGHVAQGVVGVASAGALAKLGGSALGRSSQTGALSAASVLGSVPGMGSLAGGVNNLDPTDYTGGQNPLVEPEKSSMLLIVGGIILAILFLFKKR